MFKFRVGSCSAVLLLVATGISAGLWACERDAALHCEAIAIFNVFNARSDERSAVAGLFANRGCGRPSAARWRSRPP